MPEISRFMGLSLNGVPFIEKNLEQDWEQAKQSKPLFKIQPLE